MTTEPHGEADRRDAGEFWTRETDTPDGPADAQLRLRAADILERISDAFISLDRSWRILYANREACRLSRKPLDALAGRTLWSEWPAVVGTELDRQYRRVMAQKVEAHFEHHYVTDAVDLWLEVNLYPAPDGITLFCRDISDRKRAQERLERSEERYRSLVAATAEIVWTNTAEGEMNGANTAWAAFTGQSEEQYQGYGWAEAVHPEDAAPTVRAWREAVSERKPFLFEHRLRRHDGVYRTFAIRAVPVLEADDRIREWVGIHTDITERKAQAAQQRVFLRDVLRSVTEGKLLLVADAGHLPPLGAPLGDDIPLTPESGLRDLRLRAQGAAARAGLSDERRYDLLTAASEAGMNAVVHGGGGVARVSVGGDGVVQVRVEDRGRGIAMEDLPFATLSRGFSTKASLGHGVKMMLETVDRLYLLTGPTGTMVVLEQDRIAPLPAWL